MAFSVLSGRSMVLSMAFSVTFSVLSDTIEHVFRVAPNVPTNVPTRTRFQPTPAHASPQGNEKPAEKFATSQRVRMRGRA
jgi:hypothetical protein